jgi:hypothetical protein
MRNDFNGNSLCIGTSSELNRFGSYAVAEASAIRVRRSYSGRARIRLPVKVCATAIALAHAVSVGARKLLKGFFYLRQQL